MNETWTVVAAVGILTVAIKGTGPVLLGGRRLPDRATMLLRLLAPAVLAALVATQVFVSRGSLALDERAAGLVVAVAGLILRVPTLGVVVLAAAATALVRLAG